MPWNPDRYHQFERQRALPFEDLVSLIEPPNDGRRIQAVDLGCGTGELTARLADALPTSEVLGIDSSPEMLSRAQPYTRPGVRFELRRIEEVQGTWDLVFSHAALQWVDDHHALIPRLLSLVAPGGQLAVQIPSNHDHPSHRLIRRLAGEEPFRSALDGWAREFPVLPLGEYADLLYAHGASDMTVLMKVYPHVLRDADAIADWNAGTVLVPITERLGEALTERFMAEYRRRLRERYPGSPVLYGFKRILFVARREG